MAKNKSEASKNSNRTKGVSVPDGDKVLKLLQKKENEKMASKVSKRSTRMKEADVPDGAKILKLLQIEYVDFRQSEWTQFTNLLKEKYGGRRAFRIEDLGPNSAVMFVSSSEKIVRIVWDFVSVTKVPTGERVDVLTSRTWRMTGNDTFNPLSVQDVAHQLGIHFEGLPTYRQWLEDFGRRRHLPVRARVEGE